jgi:OOP family OmpA-OmpF porin
MNRLLLVLLILLWSLAYSWFWNCHRKPYCFSGTVISLDHTPVMDSPATNQNQPIDTVERTPEEQILFKPLDVYFVSGKSQILHTSEVDTFLNTARKYLGRNPEKQLLITGHTDDSGTDASNQKLSEVRAAKVKELLTADGISAAQMITEGKGAKEPVVSNNTTEGKAKNRRATIRLKE